jgi:PD-(D/E)XK nuclease superfamily
MQETKLWYNGYTWGHEKVYNPFSIACLFKNKAFKNYWFTSGVPRFLVEVLFKNFTYNFAKTIAFEETLTLGFGSDSTNATALMFQTGYLTIENYDRRTQVYTLDYPNKEVAQSLQIFMLRSFSYQDSAEKIIVLRMYMALCANDINEFVNQTNQLFAQIPEPIFLAKYEAFYHAIIYLSLSLVGIMAYSEEQTNIGRVDMVVPTPDRIFVIEYKILGTAADAIAQIHAKKYYEKHLNEGKPIVLLGIALGKEQRGIVEWATEELGSR